MAVAESPTGGFATDGTPDISKDDGKVLIFFQSHLKTYWITYHSVRHTIIITLIIELSEVHGANALLINIKIFLSFVL